MASLISYGSEVNSIFQLLGEKENDLTQSLSWALSRCPSFLEAFVFRLTGKRFFAENMVIYNQRYSSDRGITDIEITDGDGFFIIIEAKRGWHLPGETQMTKYSVRKDFVESTAPIKRIVSLSECSQAYAIANLAISEANSIPIEHISWKEICEIINTSQKTANHQQKHTLEELKCYLKGVMTMQKKDSNWVFIVALGRRKMADCDLTYIDVVEKLGKYFCPMGDGWPKDPPNYIAFRYGGKLQSIHHIESYTATKNLHTEIEEMPDEGRNKVHYVFSLSEPIRPTKEVKTGAIYRSAHAWAMLDTLLTCDTISDAAAKSKAR